MFNLTEKDFAVLRDSLESGRQAPNNLGAMLILSIFLQALMFVLAYIVGADRSAFPYIDNIRLFHLIITLILIILSVIYAIPSIYMKQQKVQYFITILVSQNLFGILPLIMALFFLGKERSISLDSLLFFVYGALAFGLLVFLVTCVRFLILLKKGDYRVGSKKDRVRNKAESNIKSFLAIIIVASIGLVFVLQFLVRTYGLNDMEVLILIIIGILVFFAMLFVLPEQLVILYCKYRFESFNFNKNGELKPMGRKGA